jgi:hypothetical protein
LPVQMLGLWVQIPCYTWMCVCTFVLLVSSCVCVCTKGL